MCDDSRMTVTHPFSVRRQPYFAFYGGPWTRCRFISASGGERASTAQADDLCVQTVQGLTEAVASGDMSPVDGIFAALDRVEAVSPALGAFTVLDPEEVPAAALVYQQMYPDRFPDTGWPLACDRAKPVAKSAA